MYTEQKLLLLKPDCGSPAGRLRSGRDHRAPAILLVLDLRVVYMAGVDYIVIQQAIHLYFLHLLVHGFHNKKCSGLSKRDKLTRKPKLSDVQ